MVSRPESALRRRLVRVLFLFLAFASFVAGFYLAWYCVIIRDTERLRHLDERRSELCHGIYGKNYFHVPGVDAEGKARMEAFDPARGTNTIKLSHDSCWGHSDLELKGDGTLISTTRNGVRTITTIDHEPCKALFLKILTSGLLNYSDEVIEIKERLDEKFGPYRPSIKVADGNHVKISISTPELEVDKEICIYVPEVAIKNHPDIIEFRLFIDLEKEILSLVPRNDPDWHR